ncbi:MAG: hypothetical protein M5U01_12785 [Ardenticatenaceae bacterium]|nr:hypothetical protein [Ardenticatenaceae bacterium]
MFRDDSVIRAINSDGTNEHVVVDIRAQLPLFLAGSRVGVLVWGSPSPDGKQLALVLSTVESIESLPKGIQPQYSIDLLDLTTGRLHPLIQDGIDPAWSPDGTKIAYRSTRTFGLQVVDLITGASKEVFSIDRTNLDYHVDFFVWSPDSKSIALVKGFGVASVGEVWVVNAKGEGAPTQLIALEMYTGYPNWSPSGDQIAFVSPAGEGVTSNRPLNVWVVDVGTGERRQLTQNISTTGGTPDWSPDGNWIAFEGTALLEGSEYQYDLWLVARDGSELKRLTNDPMSDLYPSWVPNRNKIVFRKSGAGIWEVNVVDGAFRQVYQQDVEYVILK